MPPLLQVLTMSCKLMLVGKSESTNRNWSFICFALTKSLWQQIVAATAALSFQIRKCKTAWFQLWYFDVLGQGPAVLLFHSYLTPFCIASKVFLEAQWSDCLYAGSAFSTKKHLLVHNTTLNFPRDRSICYAEEFYLQGQNHRAMKQDWT